MDELIELERELLQDTKISKLSIRAKLEYSHNESFDDHDETFFESEVNDAFKKYKQLIDLFGENVFQYVDPAIQLNPEFKAKQEYLLCLYCMEKQDSPNNSRQKISNLFEKIVGEALKNYLGSDAEYELIDEQNKSINIENFCKDRLLEKSHHDAQNAFENPQMTPRCDLIVWKKFDDRVGKIIFLVQCKSGKNWNNGNSVNFDLWKDKIIQFVANPIKVFAITDLLEESELFDRSYEKGLIIDRARIIKWLANTETDFIKDIRQQIKQLFDIT